MIIKREFWTDKFGYLFKPLKSDGVLQARLFIIKYN